MGLLRAKMKELLLQSTARLPAFQRKRRMRQQRQPVHASDSQAQDPSSHGAAQADEHVEDTQVEAEQPHNREDEEVEAAATLPSFADVFGEDDLTFGDDIFGVHDTYDD